MSVQEGGTPTVAAKHTTEHPGPHRSRPPRSIALTGNHQPGSYHWHTLPPMATAKPFEPERRSRGLTQSVAISLHEPHIANMHDLQPPGSRNTPRPPCSKRYARPSLRLDLRHGRAIVLDRCRSAPAAYGPSGNEAHAAHDGNLAAGL